MNVPEYGTFLPRPFGWKERSHEKSSSASAGNDWMAPRTPPRTVSGYAAGCGPLLHSSGKRDRLQNHPTTLELLRESIEMIVKLPPVTSPTIPAWSTPAVTPATPVRPMTGGKQLRKLLVPPPDLIASSSSSSSGSSSGGSTSNDDSSSDSEGHHESNRRRVFSESESALPSEVDPKSQDKNVDQKMHPRVRLKGGKRLTGSTTIRSSSEFCCLLSPEQTMTLPRRIGESVLSEQPLVVRINIPSFLLPELDARLKTLQESKQSKRSPCSDSPSPAELSRPIVRKKLISKKRLESEDEKKSRNKTLVKQRQTRSDVSSSDTESDVSDGISKRRRSPTSPDAGREKHKHGRNNPTSRNSSDVKMKDGSKEDIGTNTKMAVAMDLDPKALRRTRDSRSLSPSGSPRAKARRKDHKDSERNDPTKHQKSSKDNDGRRPAADSTRQEKERSSKHRYRGHSRSRSRSPRRDYERVDGREIKLSKGRRDHEDESGSSKSKRREDSSRSHHDKQSRRRDRTRSRSRSSDRVHGRERSRDRYRGRSRSRSRERSGRKKDKDRDKNRDKDKDRRVHDSSAAGVNTTKVTVDVSKDDRPLSLQKTGHSSERREAENQRLVSQRDTTSKATSSNVSAKKSLGWDQHQKRPEPNVETPKMTTDSVVVAPAHTQKTNDPPQEGPRGATVVPSESVHVGHTKHYRDYRRYHTLAVSLKRKADEITRIQNNPRLGAIVYFLSGNAFLRAFHFNDKYLELLHPNRPDLVLKESMTCWGSMKQFSNALSNQCQGKFRGLEGLSYLLEALVYFKCHSYSSHRLRQEMQALDQLKKRPSKDNGESQDASEPFVAVPVDMAIRLMQNADDWANLSTKLADCDVAFTADIVMELFPGTFRKWCIHPEDLGKPDGKGFLTFVEQTQTVIASTDDGTGVRERVRKIPKVQWPLGTYMHLSDVMDFAEEALREYQARNDLEYEPPPMP